MSLSYACISIAYTFSRETDGTSDSPVSDVVSSFYALPAC